MKTAGIAAAFLVTFATSTTHALARPNEVLIAQLIRSNQPAAAQKELDRAAPTQADRLFFAGLQAQHQKNYSKAAKLFAATIDADPNHMNARRELAHVLFQQQKYKLAERQFRNLITLDNAPQARELYERFLNEIRNRKPYGVSGWFSLLPSSNLNRGSERLVYDSAAGNFTINERSRAMSGVGIQGGVSGYFRKVINDRSRNIFTWSVSGQVVEDSYFNIGTVRLGYTHEHLVNPKRLISLGTYLGHSWRGDKADHHLFGANLSMVQVLSPKDKLTLSAGYEWQEYVYQSYNTGPFSRLSARYDHQKSPSLAYNLKLDLSMRRPRAKHAEYKGIRLEAGLAKSWSGGVSAALSVNGGLRDYTAPFPLSGGTTRLDRFYGVSGSVQNNKLNIRGFVPKLTCSYTKNTSNIAFYQYDVTECNVGITKRF